MEAEINEIKNEKTKEKINRNKCWFFDKIKKVDKTKVGLRKNEDRN